MGKTLACALGPVLVLAIPVGAVEPPRASQGGPAPGTGRVLEIRVVERDGATPVAGVAIDSLPGRRDQPAFRGTTDEQGRCAVPVPPDVEKSGHFAVYAWKDGFVPVRVLWGYSRDFEFEGIPAAYTVLFDRGAPIGGVVRDEQGRPIAGAQGGYWLELSYWKKDASDPLSDQEPTPIKVAVLEEYVEAAAGPDDKPLDLGTLTLSPPEPEVIDK